VPSPATFEAPAEAALPVEGTGAATIGEGTGNLGGGATTGVGTAFRLGGEGSPFGLLDIVGGGGGGGGGGKGMTTSISLRLSPACFDTRAARPERKA
jgi:hypothetical protein